MTTITQPLPPMSDDRLTGVLSVSTTFLVLALITFGLRVYTRLRPHVRWGWDDWVMTLAMICSLSSYGLLIGILALTKARHVYYVPPILMMKAMRLVFISPPVWFWSITLTKISVALMLLRIKSTKLWVNGIWSMIALLLLTTGAATISQMLQCTPIEANWNPLVPGARCWTPQHLQASLYATSVIFIVTDVAFALLPLAFIFKLNRPVREKVVLGVLMGLGLIASACSIAKLAVVKLYLNTKDPIWDMSPLAIWAFSELFIGIIAACVPSLKSLFDRLYRRSGRSLYKKDSMNPSNPSGLSSYDIPKGDRLDDEKAPHIFT